METGQLKIVIVIFFCAAGVTATQLAEQVDAPPSTNVSCKNSTLQGVRSEEDLLGELLPRVISPDDDGPRIRIKKIFMQYLVQSRTFLDMIRCTNPNARQARQDDEDGDDGDDGGGGGGGGAGGAAGGAAGAAGGVLDNTNVLNGVRRILANVFTGNLIGVIQEGVALRGPEPVTNVFTDVLSTLFGSTATAGITGILGNITTTGAPQTENATLSYEEQQYLLQLQQQQLLLAQQQGGVPGQLGGVPGQLGGVPGQLGGVPGQLGGAPGQFGGVPGQLGGVPGQLGGGLPGNQLGSAQRLPAQVGSNQHYPQFQQQQQSYPQVVQQQQLAGAQPQQGIRRRPGQQQQVQPQLFQQQQQQLPVQPQAQIPQQPQQRLPQQNQQIAGGLQRQHQQQQPLQGGQQFGQGLNKLPAAAFPSQQLAGGLNRQQGAAGLQGQGLGNRRRRPTTTPIQEADEDYEDNDEEDEE